MKLTPKEIAIQAENLADLLDPKTFLVKPEYRAGDIPTVEGVTCFSDGVDLDYKVKDGWYVPSKKPGFGITLKTF